MMSSVRDMIAIAAFSAALLSPVRSMSDELTGETPSMSMNAGTQVGQTIALLGVTLDYAKILKFDQSARTIIIGNPGIVDGTMSDPRTIVLTGKAIGTTNVIVLGTAGQEISNFIVQVSQSNRHLTAVHYGAVQQTFSCIGSCIPMSPAGASKQNSAPTPAGAPEH